MRSLTQILKDFESKLQSSTWLSLKSGLIGKELIAYATHLIYQLESLRESLAAPIRLDSNDVVNFFALAYANDIPLSRVIPSVIKLKFNSLGRRFKPFELCVNVGAYTYYNIDFCNSDELVVLYQGSAKYSANYSVETEGSLVKFLGSIPAMNKKHPFDANLFSQYTTAEVYSQYLKLTKNTYAPSVRVFTGNKNIYYPLTEFSPELADPTANLYKTLIGRDGITTVVFGDSVWGKSFISLDERVQVFFLDGSYDQVSAELLKKISVDGEVYNLGKDFTVIASIPGRECSSNDLKNQMVAAYAPAISTAEQINAFCQQFPDVLDTQAVAGDNNEVVVWVKPTVESDSNFKLIQAMLQIQGDLMSKYTLKHGLSVPLAFKLSYYDLTDEEATQIENILIEEWSYANTKFTSPFSLLEVREKLYAITHKVIFAEIQVEIANQSYPDTNYLGYSPVPGTIKFYKNEGDKTPLVWDLGGKLKTPVIDTLEGYKILKGAKYFCYKNYVFLQGKSPKFSSTHFLAMDVNTLSTFDTAFSPWMDPTSYVSVTNTITDGLGNLCVFNVVTSGETLKLEVSILDIKDPKNTPVSGVRVNLIADSKGQPLYQACLRIKEKGIIGSIVPFAVNDEVGGFSIFCKDLEFQQVLYAREDLARVKSLSISVREFSINRGVPSYDFFKVIAVSGSEGLSLLDSDGSYLGYAWRDDLLAQGVYPPGICPYLLFDPAGGVDKQAFCLVFQDHWKGFPVGVDTGVSTAEAVWSSPETSQLVVLNNNKVLVFKFSLNKNNAPTVTLLNEFPSGDVTKDWVIQGTQLLCPAYVEDTFKGFNTFSLVDGTTRLANLTVALSEGVCGEIDYNTGRFVASELFPKCSYVEFSMSHAQLIPGRYFKLSKVIWQKLS